MKKVFKLTTGIVLAVVLVLAGCNGVKADEYGWYHDYASAKAVAQKQNKNMILFISADDSDKASARLKKDVFNTDEFKKDIAGKYICVNLDFSQNEYSKSQIGPESTDAEKKDAKVIEDRYDRNMRVAAGYSVQDTPAVFLTTKEGYLITPIVCDSVEKLPDFDTLVKGTAADEKKITEMVAATNSGTSIEKAKAIDVLYEATAPESRFLLGDLIGQFTQLDTKNETGLAGKYTLAFANVTAQNAFMEKKYGDAVNAFVAAAGSNLLNANEKQQAYYTAAYTLASTGSQDYDKILQYFQASLDANPESAYAQQISQMITMTKSIKNAAAQESSAQPGAEPDVKAQNQTETVPGQ